MKDSKLRTLTKEFALKILAICDEVGTKGGRAAIVSQISRSATSIGANLHEANYAASRADFINKLHIALKECYETEYWLDLLQSANYVTESVFNDLISKSGTIRNLLVKSINTAKQNQ